MNTEIKEERDCAFQYAKVYGEFMRRTVIVCDETGLTLEEALALWEKYYPDCAKHIKDPDNTAEMVIWIDVLDKYSYGKHLYYISTNAESDGHDIWETTKSYFPKSPKIVEKQTTK